MAYWLMKSEPDCFSIHDLAAKPALWDGVRNYQARNYLQQMQAGDLFLFYHSSCQPPGIAGIGCIDGPAQPDLSALDPQAAGYDPRCSEQRLPWVAVPVSFQRAFTELLPLAQIRTLQGLEELPLLGRASRLSVMPVSAEQWQILLSAAQA